MYLRLVDSNHKNQSSKSVPPVRGHVCLMMCVIKHRHACILLLIWHMTCKYPPPHMTHDMHVSSSSYEAVMCVWWCVSYEEEDTCMSNPDDAVHVCPSSNSVYNSLKLWDFVPRPYWLHWYTHTHTHTQTHTHTHTHTHPSKGTALGCSWYIKSPLE